MENENGKNSYGNPYAENNVFAGITDVGQAEDLLNRYQRDTPNDFDGTEKMLNDLLAALLVPDVQLTGSADNFHNFAVSISKISSDNRDALAIVCEGLKIHPTNTDLLADAIRYGYNCGEKEKCAYWFKTLQNIDKSKWTWRAFSFSIDYLLGEYTSSESGVTQEYILQLAKCYQEYKPDEEDAWVSEYEIYENSNMHQKGIAVLEQALEMFRTCPKCWLRYADIMMDYGEYEKAEPIIKKLRKYPKSGESINISYLFSLDGQCKMGKLMDMEGYEDGQIDKYEVLKIYKTFQLALSSPGLRDSTKQQINEYITRLEMETEVQYPPDWEKWE